MQILEESKIVQFIQRYRKKSIHFSKTSLFAQFAQSLKNALISQPIYSLSLIMISAPLTYLILSFVMFKKISLFSVILSGIFLSAGIMGYHCRLSWKELKNTSFLFKDK